MPSFQARSKTVRFTIVGAIAVALAGCAGGAKLASADSVAPRETKQAKQLKRDSDRSIATAERAVERSMQSASLRSALGLAYLQAGRFTSAATSFDDAMKLGDNSPHTALGLALAKIGSGQSREAIAILDDWRDSIPASDLGLALALAGETSRGAAILADALRGGENSAKLRQNLAFAYALDGRWREARTMMEQDVPAGLIDQRISEWATQAKPDDYQMRVAGLLGVPVRIDPGMPEQLALGNTSGVEQAAAEATAMHAPSMPAASELPAAAAQSAESPAPAVTMEDSSQPAVANYDPNPAYAPVSGPVVQNTFANSFNTPSDVTQTVGPAPRAAKPARTVRVVMPTAKPTVVRKGSHLVQLGSFSSPQGARRGWGILAARNPKLRDYRMVITPAVVRGKNFWRVAAAGFDANAASGLCSSVKNRGGVCFAYAATRVPAGASPTRDRGASGPQLARRR